MLSEAETYFQQNRSDSPLQEQLSSSIQKNLQEVRNQAGQGYEAVEV